MITEKEKLNALIDRTGVIPFERDGEILFMGKGLALQNQLTQLKQFAREASRVAEFYSHEKFREGCLEGFLMQGHRFDISCAACNEDNKGKTAREFLNSDIYKQVMEGME